MIEEDARSRRTEPDSIRALQNASSAIPPKIAESQGPRMAFSLTEDRSRASRGTPVRDNSREFAVETPRVDTRKNPSGPLLVRREQRAAESRQRLQERTGFRVTSTGERAVDESGNALRYDPKAQTPVTKQEFEELLMRVLPEEIRALMFNRLNFNNSTTAGPAPGSVAVIGDDGIPGWGAASGSLTAYGTAALYKGIFLRGWSKASAAADWVAMTVAQETANAPTKLSTEFVDGTDAYPWYAWRPTWDYPRAHA